MPTSAAPGQTSLADVFSRAEEVLTSSADEPALVEEPVPAAAAQENAQIETLTEGVAAMVRALETSPTPIVKNRAVVFIGKITGWLFKAPGRFAADFMIGYRSA